MVKQAVEIFARIRPPAPPDSAPRGSPSRGSSAAAPRWGEDPASPTSAVRVVQSLDGSKGGVAVEFAVPSRRRSSSDAPNSHTFAFNRVFDHSASQSDVYKAVVAPLVPRLLAGFNVTCLAYGQTGSGKTYSITGGPKYKSRGLIPRAISDVFARVGAANRGEDVLATTLSATAPRPKPKRLGGEGGSGLEASGLLSSGGGGAPAGGPSTSYRVWVSYLEIYNEAAYDLLDETHANQPIERWNKVQVQEGGGGRLHLKNLRQFEVTNEKDCLNLLFLGNANRMTASTPMNNASSRSHCIFTITVEATTTVPAPSPSGGASAPGTPVRRGGAGGRDGPGSPGGLHPTSDGAAPSGVVVLQQQVSKLHLVDLAGSERIHKTGGGGGTGSVGGLPGSVWEREAAGDRSTPLLRREGRYINKSLHHLELVILALQEQARLRERGDRAAAEQRARLSSFVSGEEEGGSRAGSRRSSLASDGGAGGGRSRSAAAGVRARSAGRRSVGDAGRRGASVQPPPLVARAVLGGGPGSPSSLGQHGRPVLATDRGILPGGGRASSASAATRPAWGARPPSAPPAPGGRARAGSSGLPSSRATTPTPTSPDGISFPGGPSPYATPLGSPVGGGGVGGAGLFLPGVGGGGLPSARSRGRSESAASVSGSAITAPSTAITAPGPHVHVPYRNSLLTSILRDSLGGNCHTVLVATISPEPEFTEESVSTCRFAARCGQLANEVVPNVKRREGEGSRGGAGSGGRLSDAERAAYLDLQSKFVDLEASHVTLAGEAEALRGALATLAHERDAARDAAASAAGTVSSLRLELEDARAAAAAQARAAEEMATALEAMRAAVGGAGALAASSGSGGTGEALTAETLAASAAAWLRGAATAGSPAPLSWLEDRVAAAVRARDKPVSSRRGSVTGDAAAGGLPSLEALQKLQTCLGLTCLPEALVALFLMRRAVHAAVAAAARATSEAEAERARVASASGGAAAARSAVARLEQEALRDAARYSDLLERYHALEGELARLRAGSELLASPSRSATASGARLALDVDDVCPPGHGSSLLDAHHDEEQEEAGAEGAEEEAAAPAPEPAPAPAATSSGNAVPAEAAAPAPAALPLPPAAPSTAAALPQPPPAPAPAPLPILALATPLVTPTKSPRSNPLLGSSPRDATNVSPAELKVAVSLLAGGAVFIKHGRSGAPHPRFFWLDGLVAPDAIGSPASYEAGTVFRRIREGRVALRWSYPQDVAAAPSERGRARSFGEKMASLLRGASRRRSSVSRPAGDSRGESAGSAGPASVSVTAPAGPWGSGADAGTYAPEALALGSWWRAGVSKVPPLPADDDYPPDRHVPLLHLLAALPGAQTRTLAALTAGGGGAGGGAPGAGRSRAPSDDSSGGTPAFHPLNPDTCFALVTPYRTLDLQIEPYHYRRPASLAPMGALDPRAERDMWVRAFTAVLGLVRKWYAPHAEAAAAAAGGGGGNRGASAPAGSRTSTSGSPRGSSASVVSVASSSGSGIPPGSHVVSLVAMGPVPQQPLPAPGNAVSIIRAASVEGDGGFYVPVGVLPDAAIAASLRLPPRGGASGSGNPMEGYPLFEGPPAAPGGPSRLFYFVSARYFE